MEAADSWLQGGLYSDTIPDRLLGNSMAHSGLGPPTSINQTTPYWQDQKSEWSPHSSIEILFQEYSRFCQVDS